MGVPTELVRIDAIARRARGNRHIPVLPLLLACRNGASGLTGDGRFGRVREATLLPEAGDTNSERSRMSNSHQGTRLRPVRTVPPSVLDWQRHTRPTMSSGHRWTAGPCPR